MRVIHKWVKIGRVGAMATSAVVLGALACQTGAVDSGNAGSDEPVELMERPIIPATVHQPITVPNYNVHSDYAKAYGAGTTQTGRMKCAWHDEFDDAQAGGAKIKAVWRPTNNDVNLEQQHYLDRDCGTSLADVTSNGGAPINNDATNWTYCADNATYPGVLALKSRDFTDGTAASMGGAISKDLIAFPNVNDPIKKYGSAKLTTKGNLALREGYIEVAAKLPQMYQNDAKTTPFTPNRAPWGAWPSFFMFGQKMNEGPNAGTQAWPICGEIDLFEFANGDGGTWANFNNKQQGNLFYGTVAGTGNHCDNTGNKICACGTEGGTTYDTGPGCTTWNGVGKNNPTTGFPIAQSTLINDWHIYGLKWEDNRLTFFVNGIRHGDVDLSNIASYDDAFFVQVNYAVGGHMGGIKDLWETASVRSTPMLYEYVRWYQVNPATSCDADFGSSAVASCTDGIQNQTETGVDCGGPCSACTPGANILLNGDFDATGANWTAANANGTSSFAGNNANFAITSAPATPYAVELLQNIALTNGQQYTVCYDAKSNEGIRNIEIEFDIGAPNYTAVSMFADGLNNGWQRFSHTFTSNVTDATSRLQFRLGNNGGGTAANQYDVQIDNVWLNTGATCGAPATECMRDFDCADANPCTQDQCLNLKCWNVATTGSCSDGNVATCNDTCDVASLSCKGATCAAGDYVPSATYDAQINNCLACTTGTNCTGGDPYVDLGGNCSLRWTAVDGGNGSVNHNVQAYFKVASPSGTRTMSVFLNNVDTGLDVSTSSATFAEVGPTTLNLPPGQNIIRLDDNAGTASFNVDYLRIVGQGSCTPSCAANECGSDGCGGTCGPGCDDANVCTTDSCSNNACVHAANALACDTDNNSCTTDICSGGVCTHPNNTESCASDNNSCTNDVCAGGACTHPDNGQCGCSVNADCDDGNPCTTDTCGGSPLKCSNTNNANSCDDGSAATCSDVCSNSVCAGTSCTSGSWVSTGVNTITAAGWSQKSFTAVTTTKVRFCFEEGDTIEVMEAEARSGATTRALTMFANLGALANIANLTDNNTGNTSTVTTAAAQYKCVEYTMASASIDNARVYSDFAGNWKLDRWTFEYWSGAAAPTCTDTTKNGSETDVDCGGAACTDCINGKACLVNTDCASANCNTSSYTCTAPGGTNLIANGEFTSATGWTASAGTNGTVSYAAGYADFNIVTNMATAYGAELVGAVSLTNAQQYVLCFWVKTDEAGRNISVAVDTGAAGYTNMGLNAQVPVTAKWAAHTIPFVSNATDATSRVQFKLGQNANDVQIDKVGIFTGTTCGAIN